jgi:hypothetical protein
VSVIAAVMQSGVNYTPKRKTGSSSQTGTVSHSDDGNPPVLEMRQYPAGQLAHFGTCRTMMGFPEFRHMCI